MDTKTIACRLSMQQSAPPPEISRYSGIAPAPDYKREAASALSKRFPWTFYLVVCDRTTIRVIKPMLINSHGPIIHPILASPLAIFAAKLSTKSW